MDKNIARKDTSVALRCAHPPPTLISPSLGPSDSDEGSDVGSEVGEDGSDEGEEGSDEGSLDEPEVEYGVQSIVNV